MPERVPMPRAPRIVIPGIPLHVVQRGNDRQYCFRSHSDFLVYLRCLGSAVREYDIEVHAYVLMSNHVHLLVTPSERHSVSRMMQQLGRGYVRYFNDTYCRTGTLWEGRFFSSLVESDEYLLASQRYIELNPVRANIVQDPAEYTWSSYAANGLGRTNPVLRPHKIWTQLGANQSERLANYRRLFEERVDEHVFRRAARKGLPVGSNSWIVGLEAKYNVRFSSGRRGRPPTPDKGL